MANVIATGARSPTTTAAVGTGDVAASIPMLVGCTAFAIIPPSRERGVSASWLSGLS